MKKGISLIVLVITIIVMIIIAGAIIISLNQSSIIDNANKAVNSSNKAEALAYMNIKYSEILIEWYDAHPEQEFDPNDEDETTLNTYVMLKTGNKWGVELKNNEFDVVKLDLETN